MYIVYKEFFEENGVERWYWGKFEDAEKAYEVAENISGNGCWGCTCEASEAEALGIQGMR